MKLKNILGKALVVGAVAVATLACGVTSVFASTVTYNFSDMSTTAISTSGSGNKVTYNDTRLDFDRTDDPNTITALGKLKPVIKSYSSSDTISDNDATLKNTQFTKGIYNSTSSTGSALLSISNINKRDTIEVYWGGCDSSGVVNKNISSLTFSNTNNDSTSLSTTDESTKAGSSVLYSTYTATSDITTLYIKPSAKAVVYAIVVKSADDDSNTNGETETTPSISFATEGNNVNATISNASAEHQISSIFVAKTDDNSTLDNVTAVTDNEDGTYSFTIVCNKSAEGSTTAKLGITYATTDSTATVYSDSFKVTKSGDNTTVEPVSA